MQISLQHGLITSIAALSVLAAPAFAQDECATATAIAVGANGPFDNTGSTVSAPAWGCSFVTGGDIWFSFTAPGIASSITVDTEGSMGLGDTVLEIFDACGGSSIACDDDGGTGLLSSITFLGAPGVTYFARVGGFGSSVGSFMVNLAVSNNDECSGAIALGIGPNGPFDNTGATYSTPASSCSTMNSDVWFSYTAPADGTLTVETSNAGAGSITDTVMEAWDACGGAVIQCNDDGAGLYSLVSFAVLSGTDYYFRVGDFGTFVNQGLFGVDVSFTAAPGGLPDECSSAGTLVLGANAVDTTGSTVSAPAWTCGNVNGGDTWYAYTVAGPGCVDLSVDTFTYGIDTVLQIWDACGGTLLACNDDTGGFPPGESLVTVAGAQPGSTYYVRAAQWGSATGPFTINVTETPTVLGNDECGGAVALALGDNGPFNTTCASTSTPAIACAFNAGNDLWYSYTAACTAPHTFNTCVGDFDTAIDIWDSCGGAVLACNDDSFAQCGPGFRSSLTLALTSGTTYLVRVGGYNGQTGNFTLNVAVGTNTGSAVVTSTSTCGTGATIAVSGSLNIDSDVVVDINGATGFAWVGLGLSPVVPLPAPCGCNVISNGAGGIGTFTLTDSQTFTLPCNPAFIGQQFDFQGIDAFPTSGGCTLIGVPFGLTDIVTLTIG
jgi:hypothetical protein